MRNVVILALLMLFFFSQAEGQKRKPKKKTEPEIVEKKPSRAVLRKPFYASNTRDLQGPKINYNQGPGRTRAGYGTRYDGFLAGYQYYKSGFYELGFFSYRYNRMKYSTLHLPEKLSATIAYNQFPEERRILGVNLMAQQCIWHRDKGEYSYDILTVGGDFRAYSCANTNKTSYSVLPVVSISPPWGILNNIELIYEYNFFLNKNTIPQLNTTHNISLVFNFPSY